MSNPFEGSKFNIIKHRGSPTEVTLDSGHKVEKQEYLFYIDDKQRYQKVRCSDYHGAHFLYLDPVTDPGHWFAMCTCGSPAVIVGPKDAALEDSDLPEQLLVCYVYHKTLTENGFGWHQGSEGRRWA